MAIAVRARRRRVTHHAPWMRQRDAEPEARLALGMMALVAIGIAVIMLAWQLVQVTIPRFLVHFADRTLPTRPIDGAVPVPKLTAAIPGPVAQVPVLSGELASGGRARVANTDGVGVVLYSAPRPSARQPAGLLEGTTVTVLELMNTEWARVQADNRQTGWVHAEFLVPAN
jgi:hypothetical protein